MKIDRNQVVMPINLEIQIPSDDPVRLVDEICEELDYTKVYAAYGRACETHRSFSEEDTSP